MIPSRVCIDSVFTAAIGAGARGIGRVENTEARRPGCIPPTVVDVFRARRFDEPCSVKDAEGSPRQQLTSRMTYHERFMAEAIAEARAAFDAGETPVGAVVVREGEIVGRGGNSIVTLNDPTAHAELIAIRAASATLGAARLTGCSLYATLEPCPMCAGGIVLARIEGLYFGAFDPKAGACTTLYSITSDPRLNHRVRGYGGVLGAECATLLRTFFKSRRDT